MRRATRAHRRDGAHQAITAALRHVGCAVLDLSQLGHGAPDLLVFAATGLHLLEVKTARGKVTKDQAVFHARWPVTIVHSVQEALAAVGISG